jgi:hypothetical protein
VRSRYRRPIIEPVARISAKASSKITGLAQIVQAPKTDAADPIEAWSLGTRLFGTGEERSQGKPPLFSNEGLEHVWEGHGLANGLGSATPDRSVDTSEGCSSRQSGEKDGEHHDGT